MAFRSCSFVRLAFGIAVAGISSLGNAKAQEIVITVTLSPSLSAAASFSQVMQNALAANNVVSAGTASQIQTIRDDIRCLIQRRRIATAPNVRACTTGFAPSGFAAEEIGYDPFQALGYEKSGTPQKAPALLSSPSSWFVSAWGQGATDLEERNIFFRGANLGSNTRSYTGLGGIDVVKIGIATDSDAVVIGVLGSHTRTDTNHLNGDFTKSTTPGAGLYASYIAGGFSVDFSYLVNFTGTHGRNSGIVFQDRDIDSSVATANMQYKFDLPSSWWVEPTVGFSHTSVRTSIAGFTDGHVMRFQGGLRIGTEALVGSVRVEPTLMGSVYEDVDVAQPHLLGGSELGPTDKGYLWGKGTGKLNVQWTEKFSTFVEGEIRGRADVRGYAGRFSARLTF